MNEHNPIAFAISKLQEKWQLSVKDKNFHLVRWVIKNDNSDIFKGFLKLESTLHGNLEETFVVMLTSFESGKDFAYQLVNDWLEIFERDLQAMNLPPWKDLEFFKAEWNKLTPEIEEKEDIPLLMKLFESFKSYEGKKSNLVIGLLPNGVLDRNEFCECLENILSLLPEGIAIMLMDNEGDEMYNRLFREEYEDRITITLGNLYDSGSIYKQLATQGNPNDPQVVFRNCMFEMGECAKNGNKKGVYQWGEKALLATQGSGDKLFWSSAHLVFAGFLFGFNDVDKIEKLLNNGIHICQGMLSDNSKRASAAGLLGQFYGYKAAYLSIKKEHFESITFFMKQAEVLVENDQIVLSLGAFQNALLVAAKHQTDKMREIAEKGFMVGYPLEDDLLRTSGFPVIAYYHLLYGTLEKEEKTEIEDRMTFLYSEDWMQSAKNHLAIAPEEYITK